ncbi:MAG TPA: two-component sensor histidine kinase, partial [Cytophagales bacterium]|nr:two-component sensor histidine kinase [Cytophagales bacterium]
MDASNEGFILIATFMVLLMLFTLIVFGVMLIYRRRRIEHQREIETINEHFEKELLRSQLEIQEQTMQYIGREIHDNVGHKLTLASLNNHQLQPLEGDPDPAVTEVGQLIDESLTDLRSLSSSLIHGRMQPQGALNQLLEKEFGKLQSTQHCTLEFQDEAEPFMSSFEVNSFVLRIVQEFTQNSLKHARCQRLTLQLKDAAEGLKVTIADDGVGFDPDQLPEDAGIGLLNMRQRAEIIGAD